MTELFSFVLGNQQLYLDKNNRGAFVLEYRDLDTGDKLVKEFNDQEQATNEFFAKVELMRIEAQAKKEEEEKDIYGV